MKLSDVELPSNKHFGFFLSVVCMAASVYCYAENSAVSACAFFVLGLLVFIIILVKADALLPLNMLWMRFGLVLGMIVTPIVLGITFFGLFTPIAILMRFFKRDELRLIFKKKRTHWVLRVPYARETDNFKQQF